MVEGPVVSGMWIQSHKDFTPTAGSVYCSDSGTQYVMLGRLT